MEEPIGNPNPTPEAVPAPEPTPAPQPDPTPAPEPDGGSDLDALQAELEEARQKVALAEKKRLEAEKVIEAEKRERKRLERAQMSEAEQAAERDREVAEKARQYDIKMNSVDAEKIFVGAGLGQKDYQELLESFVNEDAAKTTAVAQGIVNLLQAQTKAAAKAEREHVLNAQPAPPAGGGGSPEITKEQFDGMGYSERLKVFNKHPELFKQFTEV